MPIIGTTQYLSLHNYIKGEKPATATASMTMLKNKCLMCTARSTETSLVGENTNTAFLKPLHFFFLHSGPSYKQNESKNKSTLRTAVSFALPLYINPFSM
ncbi:hypothetical protein EGW08_020800 [Elysia chlorotica]|uniref:Uncharacterized protein n=1 Tax=Elysia chlorotica TaxID=188477 RepID=A0A433SQC6_ELYCH|nr:hypothetical protein EGW08_020800 [Elysia chlorotica]